MQRYLTIAALVALIGASAHATCTIQYACGTGATGTAPTGTSVSSGTTFKTEANTCAKENSVFSHYLATVSDYTKAQDGVAAQDATYTIPFNGSNTCASNITITLTPQWVAASGTPVVSAKSYTDSELLTRQANFTGSATDKLILFSGSTNGEFGERAVVTSLGTPNSTTGLYSGTDLSSTEVPTNSAVNTGVNRKQATVNGTANYVAMYDENAHMTGDAKGIYSSSLTDLDTLVEAGTLNSAIVDAVNSELIRVNTNGQPDANGDLWKINSVGSLSLLGPAASGGYDMSLLTTPGKYMCSKSLSGNSNSQSSCDATTYGNLSYGDWAVPFTVNNETVYVTGTSACSSVFEGAMGEVSPNQSTIDTEYATQRAASPTSSPAGGSCHCKVTDVDGNNVVSSWVFGNSNSSASDCSAYCAGTCGGLVRFNSGFRTAVFGAVEN